jgi:S-adenosylmethionine:diacylglycerol 3-amino-3-carboxypropyl transferase
MSNEYNEELKEKILEELDDISLTDFQSLMTKHDYDDVNNSIDYGIQNLIQILFDERCKDD